jgi:hypothetical protein
MSKKFFLSFLLFFAVSISLIFTVIDMQERKEVKKEEPKKTKIVKTYKYRKYLHVKNFYKDIAKQAVEISLKYSVPPAAVLAIAGVESGYGRGYVAHITGNILSLGAKRNEPELPALYLPNLKKDKSKILYGNKIKKYAKNTLEWKKRPKSLKKDYRPKNIAGTIKELDYLDKNPKEKKRANLSCIEDFVKVWINKNKKFKPFVDARIMLNKEVKLGSKDILFSRDLNVRFIYMISGKKDSFNFRKTWAPKVVKIMDNTGLIELTEALHVGSGNFDEVW